MASQQHSEDKIEIKYKPFRYYACTLVGLALLVGIVATIVEDRLHPQPLYGSKATMNPSDQREELDRFSHRYGNDWAWQLFISKDYKLLSRDTQDYVIATIPREKYGDMLKGDYVLLRDSSEYRNRTAVLLLGMAAFATFIFFLLDLILQRPISLEFTKDGIKFAPIWRNKLLGTLDRSWNDLHHMWLLGGISNKRKIKWERYILFTAPGPHVCLEFTSGGFAEITLPMLSKQQAEQFFEALRKWCPSERLSSDVIKLKEALITGSGGKGYTELWSDDLDIRHGSTHFEPLAIDSHLQDGRLQIIEELSTGGLSAVYLAEDPSGNRVVLKEAVLPPDVDAETMAKSRERFQREARLLMKVDHPNIAHVRDCFVENERDYLVLDYVPGVTLRQLVKVKGAQSEKDVLKWGKQLAETLAYLHALEPPVVHRDVTPDNVIVKEDGSVVLIDFGAANEFAGNATGTMIGKQCYIPPEQLRGKAEPKSDVYALGATLYFLLTGEDPLALSCSNPSNKQSKITEATARLVGNCTRLEAVDRIDAQHLCASLSQDQGTIIKLQVKQS